MVFVGLLSQPMVLPRNRRRCTRHSYTSMPTTFSPQWQHLPPACLDFCSLINECSLEPCRWCGRGAPRRPLFSLTFRFPPPPTPPLSLSLSLCVCVCVCAWNSRVSISQMPYSDGNKHQYIYRRSCRPRLPCGAATLSADSGGVVLRARIVVDFGRQHHRPRTANTNTSTDGALGPCLHPFLASPGNKTRTLRRPPPPRHRCR